MRPNFEYGTPAYSSNLVADINHLEWIKRLDSRFVTGICHLPCEERLQRPGLHFLQWQRLRADLITAFKIFTGLLDIIPDLFFLPLTRRGLRGHSYKVLQETRHRRWWDSRPFRWGLWNIGLSSQLPSLQPLPSKYSRSGWRTFEQRSFPTFPVDWILIYPMHYPPPPTCKPSINSHHLYILPKPYCAYVVSSGPLWPNFYHYKSCSSRTRRLPPSPSFASLIVLKGTTLW